MKFSILDNVLWAAGFIGHMALLVILVTRKRSRDLPVFAAFVAFEAFRTAFLFLVFRLGTQHGYFLAYWITGFTDYLFQWALLFEIARDVLRPTGTWVLDARRSFLTWAGVALATAAVLALTMGPPESKGLDLWDVRTTVFTSLLTCELFIAVSAAANRLGLQGRSHVVAVSRGITVWAFVALLEDFGHAVYGWNHAFVVFAYTREFVYLSVIMYWMVTFWLPEKVRAPLAPEMKAYLVALHNRVQYDLETIEGPQR